MTTHELAKQLLAAPDREAFADVIEGGLVVAAPITTFVVGEDDVTYTNFNVGDVAVTVEV